MTYTSHGHHIPGTILDSQRPTLVARCGGVTFCTECAKECGTHEGPSEFKLKPEELLVKIYVLLRQAGLSDIQTSETIILMVEAGILHREVYA